MPEHERERVNPPALPAELPQDLRDFVECRSMSVIIRNGPQAWVTIPEGIGGFLSRDAKPELTIEPGATSAGARVKVSLGFISMTLPVTISDGRLAVDTSALPMFAPGSLARDITAWVESLNAWFAANGMALGPLAFDAGQVTVQKVPRADSPPAS